MHNKLRFGIWGCGMISRYHANAINSIEDVELVGAFDINKSSMEKFCEEYSIQGFDNVEEFTSSQKIDVICICLPSGLHYETAMQCIKNKKHVVIEKPMTINVKDATDIVEEAKKNNVFVSVISQFRYTNAFKKVKEIVDSGKLGTITLGNALMKYYRSPEYYASAQWRGTWEMDGGGALMNQGIHGVDLLQGLMGKVSAVSAVAKTLVHDIQVEDTLTAVLEYENGAIGTIQATTSVFPGYNRKIEICGSNGSVVLNESDIETCDIKGYENEMVTNAPQYNSAGRPDGIDPSLHVLQLKDFVKAIKDNKEPCLNAEEGKKSVEIVCAIYESAKTGKKVYL